MELNPTDLTEQQIYNFMCSAILPRPIAWISTVNGDGITNLAPFSYFMGVCCEPMTVLFCPVFGSLERPKKDTLLNIEEVPQFVINVADERTVREVNLSGVPLPRSESEFDLTGVTAVPSTKVRPPRVLEATIALECEVQQIIEVNNGPGGGWVVLGTVRAIHAREDVYDPETMRVDLAKLAPVARLGGSDFLKATDTFSLRRYRSAADVPAAVQAQS
ncbi:MAG TPA: flavin reductase family protein [Actinoplanes sp.]|nr:flavin reductase family protein [Actinoplanes sp.]